MDFFLGHMCNASGELVELAEYLQVPVSPTYMGKGVIPEDHPLYMGIVGLQTSQRYANALFLESDLVEELAGQIVGGVPERD